MNNLQNDQIEPASAEEGISYLDYRPLPSAFVSDLEAALNGAPFVMAPASAPKPDAAPKPVHSVVIIHQGADTVERAYYFSKFLMMELGEHIPWTTDTWNMIDLNFHDVRRAAIEAAALADVVVLALNANGELPDNIKALLEEWGGRLFDSNPILIALFDPSESKPAALASTRSFLGTIADACGLTFLHTSGKSSIVEYRHSSRTAVA